MWETLTHLGHKLCSSLRPSPKVGKRLNECSKTLASVTLEYSVLTEANDGTLLSRSQLRSYFQEILSERLLTYGVAGSMIFPHISVLLLENSVTTNR